MVSRSDAQGVARRAVHSCRKDRGRKLLQYRTTKHRDKRYTTFAKTYPEERAYTTYVSSKTPDVGRRDAKLLFTPPKVSGCQSRCAPSGEAHPGASCSSTCSSCGPGCVGNPSRLTHRTRPAPSRDSRRGGEQGRRGRGSSITKTTNGGGD